jgi:hypothetical protein
MSKCSKPLYIILRFVAATLPKFVAGSGVKEVQSHPTHNITCMARSVPPPKLTWIYERDRLDEQLLSVEGQQDDLAWSIITVPGVIPGGGFEFKCHAENRAGFVEKAFILNKNGTSYMKSSSPYAKQLHFLFGLLLCVLS